MDGLGAHQCFFRPDACSPRELMTWTLRNEGHSRLGERVHVAAFLSHPAVGCGKHGVSGSTLSSIFGPSYDSGLGVLHLSWPDQGEGAESVPVRFPWLLMLLFFWWLRFLQWECRGHPHSLTCAVISVSCMNQFKNMAVFISLP